MDEQRTDEGLAASHRFFSFPTRSFLSPLCDPWQTDDAHWKHYLFRSGPFSPPSESCGLNFNGGRERWTQSIIRSVASKKLLQGREVTSWKKKRHENDAVSTNSFAKKSARSQSRGWTPQVFSNWNQRKKNELEKRSSYFFLNFSPTLSEVWNNCQSVFTVV